MKTETIEIELASSQIRNMSSEELCNLEEAPSWACEAAAVEGGVMYFESCADYEQWKNQI